MATHAMIDKKKAWRFNNDALYALVKDGTEEDRKLVFEFNKTVNRYAEHSLDWDDNVRAIMGDVDDAASRANANSMLDNFNQTRSQFHNRLIGLTIEMDERIVGHYGERFCNFPIGMKADAMKSESNRKLIMDAAFSEYVQTHPNDRQDNPTVKWVKSVDRDLNESGGVTFELETAQMQRQFNNEAELSFKMYMYDGHIKFFNSQPGTESIFKTYSPNELATRLNEDGLFENQSDQAKAITLASLVYTEQRNSTKLLSDLGRGSATQLTQNNVKGIIDLLDISHVSPGVIESAADMVESWETNSSNPSVILMSRHGYKASERLRDAENLEWGFEAGLTGLEPPEERTI